MSGTGQSIEVLSDASGINREIPVFCCVGNALLRSTRNNGMNSIQWNVKTFHELTVEQLFDVFKLRVDVFVVEQHCAYQEIEEYDRHPETRHFSGHNALGELLAYARILSPGLRYSGESRTVCGESRFAKTGDWASNVTNSVTGSFALLAWICY